jgi:hypothetical protein
MYSPVNTLILIIPPDKGTVKQKQAKAVWKILKKINCQIGGRELVVSGDVVGNMDYKDSYRTQGGQKSVPVGLASGFCASWVKPPPRDVDDKVTNAYRERLWLDSKKS